MELLIAGFTGQLVVLILVLTALRPTDDRRLVVRIREDGTREVVEDDSHEEHRMRLRGAAFAAFAAFSLMAVSGAAQS